MEDGDAAGDRDDDAAGAGVGDEGFLNKPTTVKLVREFLTAQLRLDKLPPRTAGGVSNNPVPRR